MSDHAISVQELEDMAKDAGVTFLPGDILLIRVGWTKWYDEHNEDDRAKYVTNAYAWAGLKGCEETLEWLWDHHFSAVASDNNGVEVVPMDDTWREFRLYGHVTMNHHIVFC
jgi:kynurenine formamidase